MAMVSVMRFAVSMLGLCAAAWGKDCMASDCPEQLQEGHGNVLMQKAQMGSAALHPRQQKQQKARANHAGTVSLLLAEMNELIETKGQSGMNPGELEHIHSIKALVDDTILPTVLEEVEAAQKELDELYAAIKACETHSDKVNYKGNDHVTIVDQTRTDLRVCEEKEDILKKRTKEACTTLNHTRLSVYLPSDESFPPVTAPDEEIIKYLDFMDEFYCGTYETFYHEWEKCEDYQENYTITHEECHTLQKTFEETECKWEVNLEKTCDVFELCWSQAVYNYNARVRQILDLQKERIEEYEGASNIQCLWSAWIYEYMPCTVNKTRVKECHEYKPNISNVTIGYEKPPAPPRCDTWKESRDGTGAGPVEICSEEWMKDNFGDLDLSEDILDDIRDNCIPCKNEKKTTAPQVMRHVHSYNAKDISSGPPDASGTYIKLSSGSTCDAFVESDDPNVWGIKFTPMDRTSKYIVEIVFDSKSIGMELEAGTARVTMDDVGVSIYHELDSFSIEVSAGIVDFKENGKSFDRYDLGDESLTSGFGKMTMCGPPTMEGKVEFLTTA